MTNLSTMTPLDVAQFLCAMMVFASKFGQRLFSPRFSSTNRVCSGDVVTTKIGQIGLATGAAAAFALGMEAFGWFQPSYQTIVLALLIGEALVGVRFFYTLHLHNMPRIRARVRDR